MEYNAQTGAILWQNQSDHTQQITAGYILAKLAHTAGCGQRADVWRALFRRPCRLPTRHAARRRGGSYRGSPQPGLRAATGPPRDQIAVSGGLGCAAYWFDNRGRAAGSAGPPIRLNGNPNFVRGDCTATESAPTSGSL